MRDVRVTLMSCALNDTPAKWNKHWSVSVRAHDIAFVLPMSCCRVFLFAFKFSFFSFQLCNRPNCYSSHCLFAISLLKTSVLYDLTLFSCLTILRLLQNCGTRKMWMCRFILFNLVSLCFLFQFIFFFWNYQMIAERSTVFALISCVSLLYYWCEWNEIKITFRFSHHHDFVSIILSSIRSYIFCLFLYRIWYANVFSHWNQIRRRNRNQSHDFYSIWCFVVYDFTWIFPLLRMNANRKWKDEMEKTEKIKWK